MTKLGLGIIYLLCISAAAGDIKQTSGQDHTSGSTSNTVATSAPTTTTVVSSRTSLSSLRSGNATCPNRTVNYLTHTLPRQCLRTDRALYNSSITLHSDVTGTRTLVLNEQIPETQIQTLINGSQIDCTATQSIDRSRATNTEDTSESTTASVTSSPSAPVPSEHSVQTPTLDDSESPLDTANFLSFEEWKKQNLAKLGQSLDDIGRSHPVNPNRPRPGIHNALESLGDESELDLGFAGFGGAPSPKSDTLEHAHAADAGTTDAVEAASSRLRSKDAGKTCKERTNYASFDCSATVLKTNKECKSASSILVESKDSYMLNTCSAKNKFIIVQLCNDIQIDTVVLANYEFFSGTFRHFRVSVSDRYPVEIEKWRDLGTFEGRNTREIQAFLVENPLIWAKYLRIEFLSHYGTEYYCPVTLLRVHGTTMIEDYRHEEDLARGEQVHVTLDTEVPAAPPVRQEARQQSTDAATEAEFQAIPPVRKPSGESETHSIHSYDVPSSVMSVENSSQEQTTEVKSIADEKDEPPAKLSSVHELSGNNRSHDDSPVGQDTGSANFSSMETASMKSRITPGKSQSEVESSTNQTVKSEETTIATADTGSSPTLSDTGVPAAAKASNNEQESDSPAIPTDHAQSAASSTSVPGNSSSAMAGTQSMVSINASRITASTSFSAQPAQPSTQESFFKSFHKRLQQLESNSTLSLKYIEEQSRILRDAFSKVEKRQVATTTKFLSQLNDTVMAELHNFRQAYDQLWQGTVIELDGQRETYQREMLALSTRLTMVADELVWQKRMGIVQSTLLLLCLAMALFGRSANGYIEVPLMQQLSALRGGLESPPDSPSPDSRSPVSLFRKKIWRSKTEPGEMANMPEAEISRSEATEHLDVHVLPPSPTSHDSPNEYELQNYGSESSPHALTKDNISSENSTSPKKSRKRHRKSPSGSQGNGRAKSPLSM